MGSSQTATVQTRVPAARMAAIHIQLANPEGAIQAALQGLVDRIQGAVGATVADSNGLPIASTFPDQTQLRIASAMAAMIERAARGALEWIGPNRFQVAVLEGSVHVILACDVSEADASLILIVEREGDIEGAKREILRTAMEITNVLDLDVG